MPENTVYLYADLTEKRTKVAQLKNDFAQLENDLTQKTA